MTAQEVIETLNMQPLPVEGGYYALTHLSDEVQEASVLPSRYTSSRPYYSAIYYLVTAEDFSAMHKLPTDELYYFHYGDPLELLVLQPDGRGDRIILGMDIKKDHRPQLLAPRNCWQGSRPLPGGTYGYSLVSTSMAPSYHESDPVFGSREQLQSQYPDFAELINALTRSNTPQK